MTFKSLLRLILVNMEVDSTSAAVEAALRSSQEQTSAKDLKGTLELLMQVEKSTRMVTL